MQGKTHAMAGAAAGIAAGAIFSGMNFPPAEIAIVAVAGAVSGLFPDWVQINMPGAGSQVKGVFGHRGISHWAWWPIVLAVFARGVPYSHAVAAGLFSHIVLDCLAGGAPAFWPFGRLTIAHIKTGGKIDTFFGGGALLLGFVVAVSGLF